MRLTQQALYSLDIGLELHTKQDPYLVLTDVTEPQTGDFLAFESEGRRFLGWYYPDEFRDYAWFVTLNHLIFTNKYKILGKIERAERLACHQRYDDLLPGKK